MTHLRSPTIGIQSVSAMPLGSNSSTGARLNRAVSSRTATMPLPRLSRLSSTTYLMSLIANQPHRRRLRRFESVLLGVVDRLLNLLQAEPVVSGDIFASHTAVRHSGDRYGRDATADKCRLAAQSRWVDNDVRKFLIGGQLGEDLLALVVVGQNRG